jgi:tripartite-type tricarboxylate transporter receptor subunit TctC
MLGSDMHPGEPKYLIMEQIERIRCTIKELNEHGEAYLNEIDKPRGLNWAKKTMQEQLQHFIKRLKETVDEKEFTKYLKEKNLKDENKY